MTPADVSGLGMNIAFPQTSKKTLRRNVPSIRLADKADLRVWRASIHDSITVLFCAIRPPSQRSHILTGDLCSTLYLYQKRIKLHFAAV